MSNEQQKLQHHIIRNTTPELVTLKLTNWDTKESYDIRGVFTELCLFSSIESIIASGYVTIHEQGNLISTCPIDGREFIEIKFNSTTSDNKQYEDYHRIFFVYAVDTLSEMKDTRIYTIRFTDVLGIINADMRLSIKYDMKLEDIIKNIETIIENPEMKNEEYKQILNANSTIPTGNRLFAFRDDLDLSCNTDYNMKFVVPLWKPIKLISYLTERALSHDSVSLQKDKFTDCLFFQNRKGEFVLTNYRNIQRMLPLLKKLLTMILLATPLLIVAVYKKINMLFKNLIWIKYLTFNFKKMLDFLGLRIILQILSTKNVMVIR